jgi:hypothetical protein
MLHCSQSMLRAPAGQQQQQARSRGANCSSSSRLRHVPFSGSSVRRQVSLKASDDVSPGAGGLDVVAAATAAAGRARTHTCCCCSLDACFSFKSS